MPDIENWEKYGFPDNVTFRTMYIPTVGLIKALNERLEAVNLETIPVPGYFYQVSQNFLAGFDSKIFNEACYRFVKPDKISTVQNYYGCFWTLNELEQAVYFHFSALMPQFPVKWAIARYHTINLLRYKATSGPQDWPDVFTYEDLNDTFNFKAQEAQ